MFSDRILIVISLVLSSVFLASMVERMYMPLILILDFIWLVVWLKSDETKLSKFDTKPVKALFPLVCIGAIYLFYILETEASSVRSSIGMETLLQVIPLILLSYIPLRRSKK